MKRFILSVGFAVAFIFNPNANAEAQISYTQTLKDFDRIEVYGDIYVEMSTSKNQTARVEGVGITKDDLEITEDKQTLQIKLKPRIYNYVDVKVFVSYNKIREIKAAGAAVLVLTDTISGDKLTVDALTSSTVRLQVDISNLELKAGQGATISAKGNAETLEVSANSKGLVSAYELLATKAFASGSFGGILKLHPLDYLEAKANSGGTIYYLGKPKLVKVSQSLGGKVEEVLSIDESAAPDSI